MNLTIDHLAVTAPSLAAGEQYVQQVLGVELQAGGEHPRMGTHNKLLKLGESLYLEVIAVNPQMPAPSHARWFALDALQPDSAATLATWVARSEDIKADAAACDAALGLVEPMSRSDLHWQITIPSDGGLLLDGALPSLIQWQGAHPAASMPDMGCQLLGLDIYTPFSAELDLFLNQLNFEGPVMVHRLALGERGYLSAQIATPKGLRRLGAAVA